MDYVASLLLLLSWFYVPAAMPLPPCTSDGFGCGHPRSVTQWRSFTVPFLSSFLLVQFYPTPFLPPAGCLFWPPPFFLNHSNIFGWFFVRLAPFLLIASSLSFLFFSFSAAFSFFSLAFSSLFLLNSSFLVFAFSRLLP